MRFARLAWKFEELQFGHRFLSTRINCLGVIVQSVLKDFYLEDSTIPEKYLISKSIIAQCCLLMISKQNKTEES